MKYSIREVFQLFLVFLKLGLTSFGGPIAHLGYFRDEFVKQREWLSDKSYAALSDTPKPTPLDSSKD